MILWGVLVVPALVTIANAMKAPSTITTTHLHTLVFMSMNRVWDSDDLSNILSLVSRKTVAKGGLGHPIGLADTHHFLIGIMRKHFHGFVDQYRFAEHRA